MVVCGSFWTIILVRAKVCRAGGFDPRFLATIVILRTLQFVRFFTELEAIITLCTFDTSRLISSLFAVKTLLCDEFYEIPTNMQSMAWVSKINETHHRARACLTK